MKPYDTDRSLRRFQIVGFVSIFAVIGVFTAWGLLTSLNGAVIAAATIVTETNTKKIQSKDPGMVRQILVKDGDRVLEGQALVALDDTDARSELGIVDSVLVENLAKRARIEAQRDERPNIDFPPELMVRKDEPAVAKVMAGQIHLFTAHNAAIDGKVKELGEQVLQISQQITGMEAQITANQHQIDLVKAELVNLRSLFAKGLVANTQLLAMEREEARLEGVVGETISAKAGAANKIAEIKVQAIEVVEEDRAQYLADMRDAEGKIAEFEERKVAATAKLARTTIRSPINGDVYQLSIHTIGGVVSPADTLMLIVPEADELVLQAQVVPQNIDQVAVGQPAHVRFPAFNSRFTPEVAAEVTEVSADTTRVDQNTPPFYAVRLRIPPEELAKLDGKKLKPGMPAEAFIQTVAQSPITYLIKPFMDQMAHAWRERSGL